MSLISIIGIAVALAMDAFAVSIAAGVTLKKVSFRQGFRLAWHFGLFQAMMPVIGWGAGLSFRSFIESYDHWVAFCLLLFVGGKMIKEAFDQNGDATENKDPTKGMTMVILSIATSIDALALGLSLSILNISIWMPAVIIGIVAGLFTIAGMQLGKKIGTSSKLGCYADFAGGIILIGIGVKILHEHGVFSFI
ncbi:MAG: manganese efflux pump MntP family protein [Desulfobacterales bacterium]|nr:manganese efflux pump MntP family protein [Desulfobacterales bacterium]